MTKFGDMLRKARKQRSLRKQLAYIPLAELWPKPEKVEKVPATLRSYRAERRRKNRVASHSRARNRG
jgi:hypothetical protein